MPQITHADFTVRNATDVDLAKLDLALAYLQSSMTSTIELAGAINNNRISAIEISNKDAYDSATKILYWNPQSGLAVIDSDGMEGVQSPALGMAHEIFHANDLTHTDPTQRENYATWKETIVAAELNEPTRASYNSYFKTFDGFNPTLHTIDSDDGQTIWTEKEQNGDDYLGPVFVKTDGTPVLGPLITPTDEVVCFGYWMQMEDPTYPEGSGRYVNVWIGDPVVLNLQHGSVQTQGVAQSSASFDMQNNGHPVQTGWITANEGFLVYDKEMTGQVKNDKGLVPGLASLNAIDSNHDGHLNAQDAEWLKLKVWKDAGLDGKFEQSELFTLAQLGIVDIDLGYHTVNEENNGNTIVNASHFTWADGHKGAIASVELVAIPPPVHVV